MKTVKTTVNKSGVALPAMRAETVSGAWINLRGLKIMSQLFHLPNLPRYIPNPEIKQMAKTTNSDLVRPR